MVSANYGFVIDIGTTTLGIGLVDLESKKVLSNRWSLNKQRKYGLSVIDRIKAANDGRAKEMQNLIIESILQDMDSMVDENKIDPRAISSTVIAGNTTMVHILMGYECEGLGKYPYTPENVKTIKDDFKNIFKTQKDWGQVIILPGLSAFVGGDIVGGIIYKAMNKRDNISLLIDLGTNGEIALGNKDKILISSTAVGPAFEGGNISAGVGSIDGAISNFSIWGDESFYKTIADKKPVGVCGTGAVAIVSEMLTNEIIDKTGFLQEEYFDQGYTIEEKGQDLKGNPRRIAFTQGDIRQIQLAKSAIRAGVEVLIKKYGISKDDIDHVYLAGAFGFHLNVEKAVNIGLISKDLLDKIEAIGNGAFRGALDYLLDSKENLDHIQLITQEVTLSNEKEFSQLYIDYMDF